MVNIASLPNQTIFPNFPNQKVLPTQKVIDASITALRFNEQIKTMLDWAKRRESRTVCVANVHMVMEAYWNREFAQILEEADMVTPDGMPLVWMLRQMGMPQQDRVAGMDILLGTCQLAQQRQIKVFFLGSEAEILEKMKERLEQEFPNLQISGMEPLPFRPLTEAEDKALIEKINQSDAGLVFVALGCPKQEKFIAQHKGKIRAVMIGVGAVFPVYAGINKRAPQWVRELGLEWSYRLIQEPNRLWGRYSKTIPPFIWLALKQLLTQPNYSSVSAPVGRPMVNNNGSIPIGQLLQQAGLISAAQVEEILKAQADYRHLRFGELLVQRQWLKGETVDFFAEHLPNLAIAQHKQPLGYYLKSAALLDDTQINMILNNQSQTGLRFGEMAVNQGWVKQETIDLLMKYLVSESQLKLAA